MNRPRVLIVTTNPPLKEMGGSLLFYRQFIERADYDVAVMTDRLDSQLDSVPWFQVKHPRWLARILRTRFSLFGHDFIHLFAGKFASRESLQFARKFNPDVIITGAETWMSDLAITLGKKLDVPVAGHFMDWPTYASLGHDCVKRKFTTLFKRRYHRCHLAFGICPEMLEALGPHPNAHVYYPSGNWTGQDSRASQVSNDGRFVVMFAGNLGQWYGHAIIQLLDALEGHEKIQLKVAGKNAPWSEERGEELRASGHFLGFLDHEACADALGEADALLVIMGFDEDSRMIESTSFKSKMVDYLVQQKPLIIWGPEYCTAVKHARREGFAEVVTNPDPTAVVRVAEELQVSSEKRQSLIRNGERFFKENLDAGIVFGRALAETIKTIEAYRKAH
ncbi:glycosyltransferase family 4 protein [Puniceicoccales bacterium CK1056]|uniref:Glycosyltransferase family 4 protein n=1 Tax=Oceanipulchritudo coccoides TaxID=2706888 RepID=A0A6B2M3S6_9BACT|nr:glycosyltransferase family 4 protein [Oceanipulchritudo coccoides]NDV62320.1 glycosyltransferase family 4 protein [Oceanipulchritudo coccoides]